MDSRVVEPKKLLCLRVQGWENQGVRISHDSLVSRFEKFRGWGLSDEKRQMGHVVLDMDHMVHSIQSDQ